MKSTQPTLTSNNETKQRRLLIVSGLVLKNEKKCIAFCFFFLAWPTLCLLAEDGFSLFLFTTFLKQNAQIAAFISYYQNNLSVRSIFRSASDKLSQHHQYRREYANLLQCCLVAKKTRYWSTLEQNLKLIKASQLLLTVMDSKFCLVSFV